MKIDTSEVVLSGTHSTQVEQESVELRKIELDGRWLGFGDVYAEQKQAFAPKKIDATVAASLISAGLRQSALERAAAGDRAMSVQVVQMLLDMLEVSLPGKAGGSMVDAFMEAHHGGGAHARTKPDEAALVGETFTVEFHRHEKITRSERTEFSAAGVVNTADGRQISLNLHSSMSRQETSETESSGSVQVTKLKDPLVVNLDGNGVRLGGDRFAFDLDGKGRQEEVPVLAPGSGFLVLDANGNDRADSGLELFGAQSGNGFADLAAWDDDRNRWIDENDSVFGKLRIWRGGKDAPALETLAQSGIGAFYLGSAATEFSLTGKGERLLGQVRASGVFLKEDGTPGILQQIDLAV